MPPSRNLEVSAMVIQYHGRYYKLTVADGDCERCAFSGINCPEDTGVHLLCEAIDDAIFEEVK